MNNTNGFRQCFWRLLKWMLEKRKIVRRRSLKGAIIVLTNRMPTFQCIIRNLSAAGANIEVASTLGVPDHFRLIFDDGSEEKMCAVVWRTEDKLGVTFVEAPS